MSVETDFAQAVRWFHAARSDLDTARALLGLERYAPACFHAQQAAEKAFKGLLVATGRLPKTHSIAQLLRELPEDPERHPLLASAARLDKLYIATRCPDALPEGTDISEAYDAKDAQDAIDVAEGSLTLLQQWGGEIGIPAP
ncbi:HEPN domain-containing protein [Acidiferrobacter sp.]|jgi:HEPN domain-containing protein|uniref:HEPN domain-containing protein n=1 Tax=Acidiferrobacter sp. TaxID=1872107 RepID=UPI002611F28B|nr:HEPN domain-containing protein [Acidiferrobacter sp.]